MTLLVVGVLGLIFVLLLGYVVALRPNGGLAILGFMVVSNWDIPLWSPIIQISQLAITLPDVLVAGLLIAALLGNRSHGSRFGVRPMQSFLLLLSMMLVISILRGIPEYGMGVTVNEARPWVWSVVAVVWFIRAGFLHKHQLHAVEIWIIVMGIGVCVVASIHVLQYGLGSVSSGVVDSYGITAVGGRPITAAQAVLLPVAAVVCLRRADATKLRIYWVFVAVFLGATLVTQHRTVWAAAAAGLVAYFLLVEGVQKLVLVWLAVFSVVGAVLLSKLPMFSGLSQSLATSASDSNTYDGRRYDWSLLLTRNFSDGFLTVSWGEPFGAGWLRAREDGLFITYPPHNWYVLVLLRVGIIGLVLGVGALISALLGGLQYWDRRRWTLFLPICVVLLVYAWGYNVQWYLTPILVWSLFGLEGSRYASDIPTVRPLRKRVYASHSQRNRN